MPAHSLTFRRLAALPNNEHTRNNRHLRIYDLHDRSFMASLALNMKTTKKKTFEFVVTVATDSTKAHAFTSILCALAMRAPDGCEVAVICKRRYQQNVKRRICRLISQTRKEREAVRVNYSNPA